MSLEAEGGCGRDWDSAGRAQGYQITPVEHICRCPARNLGLRPPGETAGDTTRDVLGDSRSCRSPRRLGCFKWLITCPAKTLISHSNMSGYSFCLLLPVLSLLDSRALQSGRLSPMKVLPCDHQVPLDFIFDDPVLQGAWLSTGLAAWLPAAGPPQPA